ncbi:TetR/AcrR family transcriptional regulator [Actinocorallia populi]|uniref:TetR/AcrR family transcriptional regulator n=1 Tax=Actinocorallia populi TaxID=2079200 RepID=UPI000D095B8E|nr:TetR/AcrR family transcriptional regulator [Actinocorallia populi]
MSDPRPYAALLAKGEYRKQLILAVSQRLLTRNGWRATTLGQIAQAAGISPSGLLHHFRSKQHLLDAVLEARDTYDEAHANRSQDILEQLEHVADRIAEAPEMVGMYAVLRMENLDPGAPLYARLYGRHRAAVDTVAAGIQRGQRTGRYRADLDSSIKAEEIVAFINGIETSWLIDPSTPVNAVFKEYIASLSRQLAPPSDGP